MTMLSEFTSLLKDKGIAKQSKYSVSFKLPEALIQQISKEYGTSNGQGVVQTNDNNVNTIKPLDVSKQITLTCVGLSIPGYQISTNEIHYGVVLRKIPYEKSTGECDTIFMLAGDMAEKKLFDAWLRLMFKDNHRVEYYENYISEIQINVLDDNENVIYTINLAEAYPMTVTPVQLDRSSPSNHMTFNVTWEFHKIHYEDDSSYGERKNTLDVGEVEYQDFFNNVDMISNTKNPAAQNAGMVPAPVVINPAPDIIAAMLRIDNIKFLLDKGVNPQKVASLLRTVAQDVNSLTGVPTDQMTTVANYANALANKMPVGLMGLGTTPITY